METEMSAFAVTGPLRIFACAMGVLAACSGTSVTAAAKPVVEKIGSWQLVCTAKKAPRVCKVRQMAYAPGTKSTILGWDLGYSKKKLVSTVHVPNGVLMSSGLSVKWPDAGVVRVDYNGCEPTSGCSAKVEVPKALLSKPSKKKVEFTFYDGAKKAYVYSLSLNGFQKAVAKAKP